MCATFPLVAICMGCIMYQVRMSSEGAQKMYGEAGAIADEVLSSIRTVAAFSAEKKSFDRYADFVSIARKTQMDATWRIATGVGLTMASIFFTYALGLWYGGTLVAADTGTDVADVLAVFYSILIGSMALGIAAPNVIAIGNAKGAAKLVVEICERQSKIDALSTFGIFPDDGKMEGRLAFKGVSFTYPTRQATRVLHSFDMEVNPNETIAIVGTSGSGKSTVAALLQRFYDPDVGQIMLDNFDLKSLNVQWLRQKIGFVSQEPVLFAESIYDNIRFGSPTPDKVTKEHVVRAAKLANAHTFIEGFPQGYETMVGEWGAQLSGGQKQRIAIARAILKDPLVLLLDEATSALDNESERIVQHALDELLRIKKRTTIVIAHRLSTIRNADKIAVIKDGKVVEFGAHDEILQAYPNGEYKRLSELQQYHDVTPDQTVPSGSIGDQASKTKELCKATAVNLDDPDNENRPSQRGIMTRLWKIYNSSPLKTSLAFLCAAVSGVTFPAIAIILTGYIEAMRTLRGDELLAEVTKYSYIMVGLGILAWFLRFGQLYMTSMLAEKMVETLRNISFAAMLRQEIAWFDSSDNRTGALIERLMSDPPMVKTISGDSLGNLVQTLTTLFFCLFVAFVFGSWQVTLILLLILPLLIGCSIFHSKRLRNRTPEVQKSLEDGGKLATSTIASIRTVSSLGLASHMVKRYDGCLESPTALALRQGREGGLIIGLTIFITMSAYGLIFYYGAVLVNNNATSFSELFRSLMVVMLTAQSITISSTYTGDHAAAKEAARRIFDTVDRESCIDPTPERSDLSLDGDIEFKSVSFRYPTRPESKVLNQFNLHIKRGDTVALVGTSGSGKSTVVNLLERFYDPERRDIDAGQIKINGIDISQIPVFALRQQLGYVGQEPILFSTTIAENIRYGNPKASDEEVYEAARLANAHGFVSLFPEQYNTPVGSRATLQLSGGQKQRIAIARAILRKPKILLLDEATSALDTASEALVQKAIDDLLQSQSCTAIVIAHRLSTIRNADKIVVIESGQAVEEGTHSDLIRREGGHYARLLSTKV